jgi:hypothetical protein
MPLHGQCTTNEPQVILPVSASSKWAKSVGRASVAYDAGKQTLELAETGIYWPPSHPLSGFSCCANEAAHHFQISLWICRRRAAPVCSGIAGLVEKAPAATPQSSGGEGVIAPRKRVTVDGPANQQTQVHMPLNDLLSGRGQGLPEILWPHTTLARSEPLLVTNVRKLSSRRGCPETIFRDGRCKQAASYGEYREKSRPCPRRVT